MKKLLIASTALTLMAAPAMADLAVTAETDAMSIQELNALQLRQLQNNSAETRTTVSATNEMQPHTYTTTTDSNATTDARTYVPTPVMKKTDRKVMPTPETIAETMPTESDVTAPEGTVFVKSITETAMADDQFTTLVSALKHAELVETLEGEGPYTVFAPTNAAFEKIDPETRAFLMSEDGKDELATILKAHVASGEYTKMDLMNANGEVETVGDYTAMFTSDELGGVNVEGSHVVKSDIRATNGIIHVIDEVIIPETVLDPKPTEMERMIDQ